MAEVVILSEARDQLAAPPATSLTSLTLTPVPPLTYPDHVRTVIHRHGNHLTRATHNQDGFTLVEALVVITIIAILAAVLLPLLSREIDQARATAMKSRGRGVWVAIISANMEREPGRNGHGPLWPVDFKLPVDQGGLGETYNGATEYFKKLMTGDRPENQLVPDLKPDMLCAAGFPSTDNTTALTANNIAWRVVEVSGDFSSYDAFLISKDVGPVVRSGASNDIITLNRSGPFRGRRVVWIARGGGLYDAQKKYVTNWGMFFKSTNNVPFLAD
jgi:prepilin-type N-terminal cleavage/methylation domain-containing protein